MYNFCDNCGGQLFYRAKDKANVCEQCGEVYPVQDEYFFEKKLFDNSIFDGESSSAPNFVENVKCDNCGANLTLSKYQVVTKCPYCSNRIEEKGSQKFISVDSIIPFHITRAQAFKRLKRKIFWQFNANKKLFKNLKEEDVVGIYVNTFSFDMSVFCKYSGFLIYTEKDDEGTELNSKKSKHAVGMVDKNYKDILIEANHNIDQDELLSIMPFAFENAFKFKEDYLKGYYTLETQDKPFSECVNLAERVIKEDLKRLILQRHNCEEIETIDMQTDITNRKYNYCLVPVYFVNTTSKVKEHGVEQERQVKVVINGQTGKVGRLPKSMLRFLLWLLSFSVVLVAILLLFIFL